MTATVIGIKARTATKVETASSMELAEMLIPETIRLLQNMAPPLLLRDIGWQFQSIRHVKIAVTDASGRSVETPRNPVVEDDMLGVHDVPRWFSLLIAPPIEIKDYPVIVHGHSIGTVTISSEPSDEVGEAWSYIYGLMVTSFSLNGIVLVALFLLFGRVLAPLPRLVSGLKDLESKNYGVRLPRPSLIELAVITDHFNRAAEALSKAHHANRYLNRKLLTVQDDERRRTALELHDEAGGYLFALQASATSVLNMAKDLSDQGRLSERAHDVVALVASVQGINRRILNRLRPMALGQIPLKDCLLKLLVDFESDASGPPISPMMGDLKATYDPLIDLTVYRCVQEGLLNAIRHAHANLVTILVEERNDSERSFVNIRICDDGHGMKQPVRAGIGLSGMRERVEALSGRFVVNSSSGGTTLVMEIPIDKALAFSERV